MWHIDTTKYYSAIKTGMKYRYILQHRYTMKALCSGKEASYKRLEDYTDSIHMNFRTGKSVQTGDRLVVA